jgi:hypothetical protein
MQALIQIELSGRGFDCNTSSGLRVLGLIPGEHKNNEQQDCKLDHGLCQGRRHHAVYRHACWQHASLKLQSSVVGTLVMQTCDAQSAMSACFDTLGTTT